MSSQAPKSVGDAVLKLTRLRPSFKISIARNYDRFFWKQLLHDYRIKRLVRSQRFELIDHVAHGSDLAVSKFVINYCHGKIQDQHRTWLDKPSQLPKQFEPSFKLTGVVARQAKLISEGIDNFTDLQHLESLDLSENPELDDFACDQLARQFRNSTTLKSISLNFNPQISINGLDILFRIPSIERIEAVGTRASSSDQIHVFTLSALHERKCDICVHESGSQLSNNNLDESIQ